MHGDGGGGRALLLGYSTLFNKIAREGFCVVAPYSCSSDSECMSGETSYLEILKTLAYFKGNREMSEKYPIDYARNVTVSGHSTGARAALMVAALKDTVHTDRAYLAGTAAGKELTTDLISTLDWITSVVADHPDKMYDPKLNPDVEGFKITATPVLIITGSKDTWIEPKNSAWKDFEMITAVYRIFIDVKGRGHLEPNTFSDEAIAIARFISAFGGTEPYYPHIRYFYEPVDGVLPVANDLRIANVGDNNTGLNKIGYIACGDHKNILSISIPAEYASQICIAG